jgi:hypothetical protein
MPLKEEKKQLKISAITAYYVHNFSGFFVAHGFLTLPKWKTIISGAVCLPVSGKRLYPYLVRGWNKPIFLPQEVSLSHSRWH